MGDNDPKAQTGLFTRVRAAFQTGVNHINALDILIAGLWLVFAFLVVRFALIQDIWVDETTQLSGAGLPFLKMIGWLKGDHPGIFVVPDDRMPPFSYLLDWLWIRLFGDAPLGLRFFHAAIALGGAVFLAAFLRKSYGAAAALGFTAVVALSPKVMIFAPEIRAYPIFFALTCVSLVFFLKINARSWNGSIAAPAALGLLCVLNVYTHFYALLASAAMFSALLIRHAPNLAACRTILFAGVPAGVASLGAAPFVLAAVARSAPATAEGAPIAGPEGTSLTEYMEFFLRTAGDPAHMIYPVFALAFFAGLALLAAGALLGWLPALRERTASPAGAAAAALALVAAIGAAGAIGAELLTERFDALRTSYSLWLFPVIAALAAMGATGVSQTPLWDRYGRWGALGLTVIGGAGASAVFAANQQLFIHGPGGKIAAATEAMGAPATVIYEHGGPFGLGAIPTGWRRGAAVEQWIAADPEAAQFTLFAMGRDAPQAVADMAHFEDAPALLVVRVRLNTFRDVRRTIDGQPNPITPNALALRLSEDENWALAETREHHGFYAAKIWRFERREDGDDPA